MGRSTVHYADNQINNILKRLHNKLRPAGTPVQRVEYIIELLLLRIFEIKVRQESEFKPLRKLFEGDNYKFLFSYLQSLPGEQIKAHLNSAVFPFYGRILTEARKVFKDQNLPQKVQDHLVLMEEVFANSSFTTNVQSGNMHEIIGLVAEIDENTILKTDILGDAIESALSETGGTQDIGLYRTPDHIRQMMVALADPTFEDIIYDPACGTGGFLFDAYHYVLEKVTKDGRWPSPKCPPSHPELNEYFKKYFQQFDEPMPDVDTANKFYREGVGGTEYLGMIRKMAAINLYIRGLNPANIRQGDSLALFDPALDSESKTCILSNPPFGAEKDQPAYPNVWQEYARESETTILFVKLMLDLLKKGGRCVVVVSEGFLTWDKASARTLRKKLLEEANLRAIISLPQGVFVSKLGQGAKTSILYFEKGEPTKWIWYYKIENDGFSMGVNRKPIPGSQLPEVVELFTKYVKKGIEPPETEHSFVIPAEWIKTLDPRLKERIKKETREKILLREKPKLEKKIEELKEKLQKGKITKAQFEQKKKQLELTLENRIQNRIAKELEKAHQYSFNLRTYRSDLSKEQAEKLKKKIQEKLNEIKGIVDDVLFKLLQHFDSKNATEVEMLRELLEGYKDNELLKEFYELLREKKKYPFVMLGDLLVRKKNLIEILPQKEYREITLKLYGKGITERRTVKGEELSFKECFLLEEGDIVTSIHQFRNGCFAVVPKELAGAIVSKNFLVYEVDTTKVDPLYLQYVVTAPFKIKEYQKESTGGATPIYPRKKILEVKVPLPPLDVQKQIVEKIEKQKSIIQGAEKILEGWEVDNALPPNKVYKDIALKDICILERGVTYSKNDEVLERGLKVLRSNNIDRNLGALDLSDIKLIRKDLKIKENKKLKKNDILITLASGSKEHIGKVAFIAEDTDLYFGSFMGVIRISSSEVLPKYLYYQLRSNRFNNYLRSQISGANINNLNSEILYNFSIPLPPLDIQRKIVEELDKEMKALEKVRILKEKAEKRIEQILEEVWGEEG